MKYLKVDIEGPFVGTDITHYEPLDDLTEYTDRELGDIAAEVAQYYYSYGHSIVAEDEVPADDR